MKDRFVDPLAPENYTAPHDTWLNTHATLLPTGTDGRAVAASDQHPATPLSETRINHASRFLWTSDRFAAPPMSTLTGHEPEPRPESTEHDALSEPLRKCR